MFSQQMRLSCDSNSGAKPIKPLKGTPLPVEPTLYWFNVDTDTPFKFNYSCGAIASRPNVRTVSCCSHIAI
ncbi:hypothetical protein CISIN_1g035217mg [Citrus sinensis]|uniref:Uncharacterized protein n=1 Tax=Citrus sinensis TaxID=2711 RepID=A0A067F8P9_CITSI|nr:hypothetical protein CISIN_1g035217mg [Citrus sinensis]